MTLSTQRQFKIETQKTQPDLRLCVFALKGVYAIINAKALSTQREFKIETQKNSACFAPQDLRAGYFSYRYLPEQCVVTAVVKHVQDNGGHQTLMSLLKEAKYQRGYKD